MCRSITCIILTVFNIALFVGGLALVIVGALMRWNKQWLAKICQHAVEFMKQKLGEQGAKTAEIAVERIQEMAGPFALVVFIGGLVIMCFATLAFIGLCCHIQIVMKLYAAIVGALFVAHIILLIIYFANRELILKPAHTRLQEAVLKYESIQSGTLDSALLTILMPTVGCCGFNNASDFNQNGALFTHTDKLDNVEFRDLKYPIPCCNLNLELKSATGFCPSEFNAQNSYIEFPCKKQMDKQFFDKVAYGSIAVLILSGVVFVLTIIHIKCTV